MAYFPAPPATSRTVTGGTISTNTVTTSTGTCTVVRDVTPIFLQGRAGVLTWSVQITANGAITDVVFSLVSGASRVDVTRTAVPASAVLQLPAGDAAITLRMVVRATVGRQFTIEEAWSQDLVEDAPLALADTAFGIPSPNGVPVPPPSLSLPDREASSPARRSPQVRAAQAEGSNRPDLLDRVNSAL